jgi:hypothetical protein
MNYPENMLVEIIVSDPWDWGTDVGCGPLAAKILKWKIGKDSQPMAMLLCLLTPQVYKGMECQYFVASPRHVECHIEDVVRGKELACGLVHIPEAHATSSDPFDLSWWRGGVALICTVRAKLP